MIDPSTLQKLSQSKGIDRYSLLREYIQVLFLNELYSFPQSQQLVFKGGTALRFFFPSNRYSEDLDFTTNLEAPKLIKLSNDAVGRLLPQLPNLTIRDLKTPLGFSRKINLSTQISPQPLTIKLDFSQRESVFSTQKGVIKTDLPVTSTILITYMDFSEILAEKWRAILNRNKGRDIYDMWYLLHHQIKPDITLIQKKLDFYGEKYDPHSFVEKISRFDQKLLDRDLRPFLPQKDREVITVLKNQILSHLQAHNEHNQMV